MKNERARLNAMKRYLKHFPDLTDKLQDIVALASQLTGVPVAFITLLDKEIQWIKVKHVFPVEKMPGAISFCPTLMKQDVWMFGGNAFQTNSFQEIRLFPSPPR